MVLMEILSCMFFLTIAFIILFSYINTRRNDGIYDSFLPKSRTEMIKGMAAVAIVFSHIASYSKGVASAGLLRYYNLFCASLGGIGVNLFFFISGYGNWFSVSYSKMNRVKWFWKRCATLLVVYAICHSIVLCVLYVGGYRPTVEEIIGEFMHLTIPYSSVWYVKIQLLVYFFLIFASFWNNRSQKVITVTILCLCSSVILFSVGLDEKWWKSTLCFAVGVCVGAYRTEIEKLFIQYKKTMIIGSVLLFPGAYICAALIDAYLIKTVGNVMLCIAMVVIVQGLQMDNVAYFKLGSYSLPLYLIHRSFVAYILDDGVTTVPKVGMIVILSIVFTIIAKIVSDIIIERSFEKKTIIIKE